MVELLVRHGADINRRDRVRVGSSQLAGVCRLIKQPFRPQANMAAIPFGSDS